MTFNCLTDEIIAGSVIGEQLMLKIEMEKKPASNNNWNKEKSKETVFKYFLWRTCQNKINLYISGDISEYCSKLGITKCRYFQKKNELVSESCIDRYYWNSEPMLDTKKKFLLFLESSFINLGLWWRKN